MTLRRTLPRRVFLALVVLAGCELSAGDPKLPPAAQTLRPEPSGENPDADLVLAAQESQASAESPWSATGYEGTRFGWRLPFQDAAQRRLVGGPWRLDNWIEKAPGRWQAKGGARYMGTFEVDDDGDDKIAASEKHLELLFDIKLVNEEDDGVAWIKTRTLDPSSSRRKLELVTRDYVDSLSGTGTFQQMDLFGRARERKRHLTTILRDVRESHVGLHRALRAVADIADTDELAVDPHSRLGQLRLVVARVGYFVRRRSASERSAWPLVERRGGSYWKKTAILVVGCLSGVDDPEKSSPLEELTSRLTFTEESAVIEGPRPADRPAPPVDASGASAI